MTFRLCHRIWCECNLATSFSLSPPCATCDFTTATFRQGSFWQGQCGQGICSANNQCLTSYIYNSVCHNEVDAEKNHVELPSHAPPDVTGVPDVSSADTIMECACRSSTCVKTKHEKINPDGKDYWVKMIVKLFGNQPEK